MSEEIIEKIYVRMIDGTMSFVPVNAKEIRDKQYEILEDEEYLSEDDSVLYEFYPGDIVEVDDHREMDDVYQYDAKELIRPSNRNERLYLEFKFKATISELGIGNEEALLRYKLVIEQIKSEIASGKFFYRGIRETILYLERVAAK